jgi:hypothetical protein
LAVRKNVLASWFIEDEDAALLKECSTQTEKLSLSVGEERLIHFFVKRVFTGVDFGGDDVPYDSSLQCANDGLVGMNSERVSVESYRVGEEERVLGEAAELLAHEGFRDSGDVLAVEQDLAGGGVGHAEEGLDERAFAAAAAADEAEFFTWTDGKGDVLEDRAVGRTVVDGLDC